MTKRFYIWKDPNCGGSNVEWVQLTGKQFYAFTRSSECAGRYFITMKDMEKGTYVKLEATKEKYLEWKREQRRRSYRASQQEGIAVLSMEESTTDDEASTLHDIVADDSVNVEQESMRKVYCQILRKAISTLSEADAKLLMALYVDNKSQAEIAREEGVNRSTISRRVDSILLDLRKFF